MINETTCGGPLDLTSTIERQEFSHTGMRWQDIDEKKKIWGYIDKEYFDSCYYQIGNKKFEYKDSAKIKLKFTLIEEGVDIYVNMG